MRVALLTNILTPYRVPVYRELARREGESWRFFVNAAGEFNRSWQIDPASLEPLDIEVVPGWSVRRRFAFGGGDQRVTSHLPVGLWPALWRQRPDVVVSAELGTRTMLAWLYCAITGVPLVIWSYHSKVSAQTSRVVRAIRRALLSRARAVVGMGTEARDVLREHGVPDARIFDAPNAHDVAGLAEALNVADPAGTRDDLVEKHGCRRRIALVAGRLVGAKGIGPLIRAWSTLPAHVRDEWTLLFVGEGPLSDMLDGAARGRACGEIVRLGSVSPPEMASLYAASELLVFPSLGDPWGLVVNEAFACGVPVLCSTLAGCAADLVKPGRNGWLVDPRDPGRLAAGLLEALTSPDRSALGSRGRIDVAGLDPARMAAGISRAVAHAVRPGPGYIRRIDQL